MPSGRTKKIRKYVTLDPVNVQVAYKVVGKRRLSRLLDKLLEVWAADNPCSPPEAGDTEKP